MDPAGRGGRGKVPRIVAPNPPGTAVPFVIGGHVHRAVAPTTPPTADPTEIDYLGMVDAAHDEQVGPGAAIDFTQLDLRLCSTGQWHPRPGLQLPVDHYASAGTLQGQRVTGAGSSRRCLAAVAVDLANVTLDGAHITGYSLGIVSTRAVDVSGGTLQGRGVVNEVGLVRVQFLLQGRGIGQAVTYYLGSRAR
jgi:hypothetical protein